jgi:hypothetical protein
LNIGAFSSEGSRQENASKQKFGARFDSIGTDEALEHDRLWPICSSFKKRAISSGLNRIAIQPDPICSSLERQGLNAPLRGAFQNQR